MSSGLKSPGGETVLKTRDVLHVLETLTPGNKLILGLPFNDAVVIGGAASGIDEDILTGPLDAPDDVRNIDLLAVVIKVRKSRFLAGRAHRIGKQIQRLAHCHTLSPCRSKFAKCAPHASDKGQYEIIGIRRKIVPVKIRYSVYRIFYMICRILTVFVDWCRNVFPARMSAWVFHLLLSGRATPKGALPRQEFSLKNSNDLNERGYHGAQGIVGSSGSWGHFVGVSGRCSG